MSALTEGSPNEVPSALAGFLLNDERGDTKVANWGRL